VRNLDIRAHPLLHAPLLTEDRRAGPVALPIKRVERIERVEQKRPRPL
jgi:hypothetical protein